MTVPVAAASAAGPTPGGRHASIVAEGICEVTELSRGSRDARMMGVPAGTEADGNTVCMAAAAGVGATNLALPSATAATTQLHAIDSQFQTTASKSMHFPFLDNKSIRGFMATHRVK